MPFHHLLYEKNEGVSIITLNRPKMMNALSDEMMTELGQLLDQIANDEDIKVVILTGSEKFFAVGADINEVTKISSSMDAHGFATQVQSLLKKLSNLPRPVIAAVSGMALGGGCEICLACDVRIAAENASFGLPEIKLGILPGAGGTQRLPRLVGIGRAKEMLFCGDPIDAKEAYRIGLVNKVVPIESLMNEAKKMAMKFATRPPTAVRTIKNLVNAGMNMNLEPALTHESCCLELLFSTEDQKEGMKAFLEKREPVFKGR